VLGGNKPQIQQPFLSPLATEVASYCETKKQLLFVSVSQSQEEDMKHYPAYEKS
jgi:hypothetical protein